MIIMMGLLLVLDSRCQHAPTGRHYVLPSDRAVLCDQRHTSKGLPTAQGCQPVELPHSVMAFANWATNVCSKINLS
jgi:hypothetical protein